MASKDLPAHAVYRPHLDGIEDGNEKRSLFRQPVLIGSPFHTTSYSQIEAERLQINETEIALVDDFKLHRTLCVSEAFRLRIWSQMRKRLGTK